MKGLFGQSVDGVDGLVVTADSVNNGVIRFRRYGHRHLQRLQLKRLATVSHQPPVKIKVTREVGAALSEAEIIEGAGNDASVEAGDQFQVDKWVLPSEAMLKVYVPKPAPVETILKTVAEISRLKSDHSISWLGDATLGNPTHVMSWDGERWIFSRAPPEAGPSRSARLLRRCRAQAVA